MNSISLYPKNVNVDLFMSFTINETGVLSKQINITNVFPNYSSIINGRTTINVLNHVFEKKILLPSEISENYKTFYDSTQVLLESITKNIGQKEFCFEDIFTIMWNILIMINSLTKNNNPIQLDDNDINISKIMHKSWEVFPTIHTVRKPLIDYQKSQPLTDFNSLITPYKQKEIEAAKENSIQKYTSLLEYQNLLYENYFYGLLLITHYRCEYEQLL